MSKPYRQFWIGVAASCLAGMVMVLVLQPSVKLLGPLFSGLDRNYLLIGIGAAGIVLIILFVQNWRYEVFKHHSERRIQNLLTTHQKVLLGLATWHLLREGIKVFEIRGIDHAAVLQSLRISAAREFQVVEADLPGTRELLAILVSQAVSAPALDTKTRKSFLESLEASRAKLASSTGSSSNGAHTPSPSRSMATSDPTREVVLEVLARGPGDGVTPIR